MKSKHVIFIILLVFLFSSSVSIGHYINSDKSDKISKFDQEQKKEEEIYVYITKTGEKYHKETCRYLKKSKIKITLKEAKEKGYKPCKVCKPPQ